LPNHRHGSGILPSSAACLSTTGSINGDRRHRSGSSARQRRFREPLAPCRSRSWGKISKSSTHGILSLADQAAAIPRRKDTGRKVCWRFDSESSEPSRGCGCHMTGLDPGNCFNPRTGIGRLVTLAASQAPAAPSDRKAGRTGAWPLLSSVWRRSSNDEAFDPPGCRRPIRLPLCSSGPWCCFGEQLPRAEPPPRAHWRKTQAVAATAWCPPSATAGSATMAKPWPGLASIPAGAHLLKARPGFWRYFLAVNWRPAHAREHLSLPDTGL